MRPLVRFGKEIAPHRPTAGSLAVYDRSLASSLIAQPTRYRPLHSDVRACLATRVNRRVMANHLPCGRPPTRAWNNNPKILRVQTKQRVTPLSVPEGANPSSFDSAKIIKKKNGPLASCLRRPPPPLRSGCIPFFFFFFAKKKKNLSVYTFHQSAHTG